MWEVGILAGGEVWYFQTGQTYSSFIKWANPVIGLNGSYQHAILLQGYFLIVHSFVCS